MRELTCQEIGEVDGGAVNLVAAAYFVIQAGSSGMTGYGIGSGVNIVNQSLSNMSLGEALYRTFN